MSPPSQPAHQTRQFCPAPTALGRAEGLGASRYCGRGVAGLWVGGAGAGRYCGGGVGGRLLHTASSHGSSPVLRLRRAISHDFVLCVVTDRCGWGAERLWRATGGVMRRGVSQALAWEPWRAKDGHAVLCTGGHLAATAGGWRRGAKREGWPP